MLRFLAFLIAPDCLAEELITGRAPVIDGYTIEIRDERFSLFGLDATQRDNLTMATLAALIDAVGFQQMR